MTNQQIYDHRTAVRDRLLVSILRGCSGTLKPAELADNAVKIACEATDVLMEAEEQDRRHLGVK